MACEVRPAALSKWPPSCARSQRSSEQGGAAGPSEAGLFWTGSAHLPFVFFGLSLSGKVQRLAGLDEILVQFHRSKREAKQSRASCWPSLTHAQLRSCVFNGDVGGLDLKAASAVNGLVRFEWFSQ